MLPANESSFLTSYREMSSEVQRQKWRAQKRLQRERMTESQIIKRREMNTIKKREYRARIKKQSSELGSYLMN